MNKTISISKKHFNKAAIKLLNCFLDMSEYEISIIVGMLDNNITILTKDSRAKLVNILNLKTMSFNNYIKRLKDKEILIGGKYLSINPNISSLLDTSSLSITIKTND